MERTSLTTWIERLGRAWEQRDAAAAAELFSADVIYAENPFDQPLRGRAAVRDYWQAELAQHDQVQFRFEIIATTASGGVIHWHTTLRRPLTGAPVALDGIIVVELDAAEQCRSLREWWHIQ